MGENPEVSQQDWSSIFGREINYQELQLCQSGKSPKFSVGQQVKESGYDNEFTVSNMFYYYPWENWVYSDGKTNILISEVTLRLVDKN